MESGEESVGENQPRSLMAELGLLTPRTVREHGGTARQTERPCFVFAVGWPVRLAVTGSKMEEVSPLDQELIT